MKKKFQIILLLLFIPFLTRASIVITINSPKSTGLYSDTVKISVGVVSPYSLDTIRATIAGRSVLLTPDADNYYFENTMVLTGLPQGALLLTVYAKDALGNTQTTNQYFNFDSKPTITVTSPINYASFLTSKIHVKASANDPGHTDCAGQVVYGGYKFNFVNTIDTILDVLPTKSYSVGNLEFFAIDNADKNRITAASVPIFIEKSTFLKPFFTNTGRVIDFKDNRALVLDIDANNMPQMKIVNITDQSTEVIDVGSLTYRPSLTGKFLDNGGVAVLMNRVKDNPFANSSIYIWNNGVLKNIDVKDEIGVAYELRSWGKYLLWPGTLGALYLTDLTNFATTIINDKVVNNNNDFGADGTIVYSKMLGGTKFIVEKYKISTGAVQTISNPNEAAIYPSVDKNNIVYTQVIDTDKERYNIHLYDGVRDTIIGQVLNNLKRYKLYDGYIAYSKIDNSNVEQVWTRSPGNVFKQQSFFSVSSYTDALSNKGRLIFNNGSTRYYADSLTTYKPVQSNIGTVSVINNDFYLTLGGSIYKFDIPSAIYPPQLTSFSPASAATGATVTLKGSNFTNVTTISFGGAAAASYQVVSDTVMTAVVGVGASGSITLNTAGGTASMAGFTYLPPPVIASFLPTTATAGVTVTITGTNFTGATAVSFGGTPATSFTVNSGTSIIATVAAGASGNVAVTTANGNSTLPGFTFVPVPTIMAAGPTDILSTGSVTLSTIAVANYTYQWLKDGATIVGTNASFVANQSGVYTLKATLNGVSQVSAPIVVNVTFTLPADNFKLTNTSATCKGSTNGAINITAQQNLSYTATVTNQANVSTTFPFSTTVDVNNLAAGTYNVCIAVAGQTAYQQCFTSVIDEPKDLSVYATVVPSTNQVVLSLAGGDNYHIKLNGVTTNTTARQATMALKPGLNTIAVSTDKDCQGVVVKTITIGDGITFFPNPFTSQVNLNLGNTVIKNATVRVYDAFTKTVYSKQYTNQLGTVQIDLSRLIPGTYVIDVITDGRQNTHKIIKQ
jgi:hypothetical protein